MLILIIAIIKKTNAINTHKGYNIFEIRAYEFQRKTEMPPPISENVRPRLINKKIFLLMNRK